MNWRDTKRRVVQKAIELKEGDEDLDPDYVDRHTRFSKLYKDMNDLGAGYYETLVDTKVAFNTSYECANVLDKHYNGTFADPWKEVDGQSKMKLHGAVTRYKEAWNQAHNKLRPSAAATVVDRALGQLRYFVNESVPEVKRQCSERDAAMLDYNSYRRRLQAAEKSTKEAMARTVPALRQKTETSRARYEAMNTAIKDELVKTKLARDTLVEEATITFIVCQHAMFQELTTNLADLVAALPEEKVLTIQKKITDMAMSGGPNLKKEDSSATKVLNLALGTKGRSDYVKSDAEATKERAAADQRTAQAVALAKSEQGMLSSRSMASAAPANPLQAAQPPPPPPPAAGERFKALFDCEAESPGDLAFRAGEIIMVAKKDPSGWWVGSIGPRNGQFPANYVGPA